MQKSKIVLYAILQAEGEATNFQRASVTLGAGVEIYAKRVDDTHTQAFKMLTTFDRAGGAAEGSAQGILLI